MLNNSEGNDIAELIQQRDGRFKYVSEYNLALDAFPCQNGPRLFTAESRIVQASNSETIFLRKVRKPHGSRTTKLQKAKRSIRVAGVVENLLKQGIKLRV
jgi:hypothetical protein